MSALLDTPVVVKDDVRLRAVRDLAEEHRRQFDAEPDDFVVTVVGGRQASTIIDRHTALLLEVLRTPRRLADAVALVCQAEGVDAAAELGDMLDVVVGLVGGGIIRSVEDSPTPAGTDRALPDGYQVQRRLGSAQDTLVAVVETPDGQVAVAKVARNVDDHRLVWAISREAEMLRALPPGIGPDLLEEWSTAEAPGLAMSFVPGVSIVQAAGELRGAARWGDLLDLLAATASQYARLHTAGIGHGDVHPGNVMVLGDGTVRLIDFGSAGRLGELPFQGGVAFYTAPEHVASRRARGAAGVIDDRSECYSLAALLWLAATGEHYLDFRLESSEFIEQVTSQPPRPFPAELAGSLPGLEAVLRRPLSKEPGDRGGVAELAGQLGRLAQGRAAGGIERTPRRERPSVDDLMDVLDPAAHPMESWVGPRASLGFGAAGVGMVLRRAAVMRGDATLLAGARVWAERAMALHSDAEAFCGFDGELDPRVSCPASLFNSPLGVLFTEAAVLAAYGQSEAARVAATRLAVDAVMITDVDKRRDLLLGQLGVVLAAAALREEGVESSELDAAARAALHSVWADVADEPPIGRASWQNLGVAHGWGGLLYATMRWHEVAGDSLPDALAARLGELFACARPVARGQAVPWCDGGREHASMPGWCNGSAGLVHVATSAARCTGDPRFLAQAERFAWHCFEAGSGPVHACCGSAGRVEALLAVAAATERHHWLDRAVEIADRALDLARRQRDEHYEASRLSVMKGDLGLFAALDAIHDRRWWDRPFPLTFV